MSIKEQREKINSECVECLKKYILEELPDSPNCRKCLVAQLVIEREKNRQLSELLKNV